MGLSIGEIVYRENQDGRFIISSIEPRPLEQFSHNDKGWIWHNPQGGTITVLPEKVLVSAVNVHSNNPYGDALLSRVYWAWFNKNYGEQFWAKFAERHASPLTVVKSALNSINHEEATQELASLAAAVAGAVSAGTLAMSDQELIEFIEAKGDGAAHEKFVRHQTHKIQKTLLGRVLTSDLENSSRAAQEVEGDFASTIADADLSFCEQGLQHLLQCLLQANGDKTTGIYFSYKREKRIDRQRWERDVALLQTGLLKFSKDYFIEQHGFEPHYLDTVTPMSTEPQEATKKIIQASLSALSPAALEVEAATLEALQREPEDLSEVILKAAGEASSEHDLILRLNDIYAEIENERHQQWLASALALAEAQGFYHAGKGVF